MRDGSSESIELPYCHDIETAAIGICHESVEFQPGICSAGDSVVDVLASDFPSSIAGIFSEFCELHFGVLAVFR
jgi:hypothetical protein